MSTFLNRLVNYFKINRKIESIKSELDLLNERHEQTQVLMGGLFSQINYEKIQKMDVIPNIQSFEFKVFSQFGDDGIIQLLINAIDIPNKNFIEFGVEDYSESNTRFLLQNNNWSGFILDGSDEHNKYIQKRGIAWRYDIIAERAFITKENINELLLKTGFDVEIGILSIDIDGNDYWIWKEITVVKPIVVIVEYNSVYGTEKPWSIPYKADFNRTEAHYSNLYWGVSLLSLCDLAEEKGYDFIGCNSAGNNSYFVRKDKNKKFKSISVWEGFISSKFKESRDQDGNTTFISGNDRLKKIEGLQVVNTRSGLVEKISL